MTRGKRWTLGAVVGLGLLAVMVVAWRMRQAVRITEEVWIPSIMGTATTLKAVAPAGEAWRARKALEAAEAALRGVESRLSDWVGTTEVGRFNASPAGIRVRLSPETVGLLEESLRLSERTGGAFDVTCRPLVQLWRRAGELDCEPTAKQLATALEQVGWQALRIEGESVEKLKEGMEIDLGAIAKGHAVDLAVAAMQREGVQGGLVQCGGDLRVFGEPPGGGLWRVEIQDPTAPAGSSGRVVGLEPGAVSTSGNSERFVVIGGRRRSHIVDPRNGQPVDAVPRVTAVAPTATLSDGWSTALTVLGPAGLRLLPPGVEAVVWSRNEGRWTVERSAGFPGEARE